MIRIIKAWANHLRISKNSRTITWTDPDITSDAFNEFRINDYDPDAPLRFTSNAPASTGIITTSTKAPKIISKAHEFRKGTKRDKSHYSVLKDEKYWDTWRMGTISTVYAHGCEDILSPSYRPKNADETLLLTEQNNFMYDVFNSIIQTTMGRHFVQKYFTTRDAQALWTEYSHYMRRSTRADIEKEDLLTALTSNRLDSGYKGTTQKFIVDWLRDIRIYESLTQTASHFPDAMKKAMLQNALNNVKIFRNVKDNELLEIAKGRGSLNYEQYVDVVQGVASSYDMRANKARLRQPTASRFVNETNHLQEFDHDDEIHDEPEVTNREHFDDNISVYAIDQRRRPFRKPALPKAVWQALSMEDQQAWDQVSDQGKRNILFAYKRDPPKVPTGKQTTVSLHQSNPTSEEHSSNFKESIAPTPSTSYPVLDINATEQTKPSPSMSLQPTHKLDKVISNPGDVLHVFGKTARKSNMHYIISRHSQSVPQGSLIDRGANGGIAGSDVRVIAKTDQTIDVSGIDNHRLNDLPIVTAGGVVQTQRGPAVAILHQYAYARNGKTVHSCLQLEDFATDVNDRPRKLQGLQRLKTLDGYVMPLNIVHGLAYLTMRPFTDREWDELPHLVLTSDNTWDPSKYDLTLENDDANLEQVNDDDILDNSNFDARGMLRNIDKHQRLPTPKNYDKYAAYFLDAPKEVIAKTFASTTQYARSGWLTGHLYNTHKAPFPALNVPRRNEPVATDTIFADTPSVWGGYEMAQFFTGKTTIYGDIYAMNRENQFVQTLFDVIRHRGAMDTLISDSARVEISQKVKDVLRHFCIKDWQSEPHHQHQNFAERRIQILKRNTNRVLNISGAPPSFWLFCMKYVLFIMNRMALKSINWRTPYEMLHGSTPDISMIMRFKFWDLVYFNTDPAQYTFPSTSNETLARFVGFSESVGHTMTYILYAMESKQILYRSRIKLANDPEVLPNVRLLTPTENIESTPAPTEPTSVVTARSDSPDHPPYVLDPDGLIGRTFLTAPSDDGRRFRLKVLERLNEMDDDIQQDPATIKFRCRHEDSDYEEIVAYNELLDYIENDDGTDDLWQFKAILDHSGPLKSSDDNYKGSQWNVKVNWENGETTWEPLRLISKDDPTSCAIYAAKNNLLHLTGWKQFARLARREKQLLRMVRQSVLHSFRHSPVYKYGVQVPRNHHEAMALDKKNGNRYWEEAEETEIGQILAYDTFKDLGKKGRPPIGYKKIRMHLIYDVKHDGRRKCRCVAGGHLTGPPLDSVYSPVVSIRGLRIVIFLAELNKSKIWCTDIGNAYLESITKEKVYIIAGPEFGELEGNVLVFHKACYGLKSSGARWHERLSDVLLDMQFFPSRAEDDIWMRKRGEKYEYIARYVDDLAIVSDDPEEIIRCLEEDHKFKLKGTGPINHHLGCDFERNSDGILSMFARKYILRMADNYHRMFGEKPRTKYTSPLEKGDHPELDDSEELKDNDTKIYQSLIGALQWAVTIGRFDIATATMSMSKFRAQPRKGHLERVKRIIGYLLRMQHGQIQFRTEIPDYSSLPDMETEWTRTVYGKCHEEIPEGLPEPIGNPVVMTTYVDANLYHDVTTGRAVTGTLHVLNQTIIDAYSKRQSTVQTATYGSEFVAARIASEQVMDIRLTLRYLGVPIKGPTYMFGDNRTVVNSSTIPNAKLHKRHIMLSYHRVREAIAAGMIAFYFIEGDRNPADIVTKHWGYQQIWDVLKVLMFPKYE